MADEPVKAAPPKPPTETRTSSPGVDNTDNTSGVEESRKKLIPGIPNREDPAELAKKIAERQPGQGDVVETELWNIHEGRRGRDGGPYLDNELRVMEAKRQATIQGTDPNDLDYENLPTTAGNVFVPQQSLPTNIGDNPSADYSARADDLDGVESYKAVMPKNAAGKSVTPEEAFQLDLSPAHPLVETAPEPNKKISELREEQKSSA